MKNKKILVSGAAGSIGSELANQLLKKQPKKLYLLDSNETGVFNLLYDELESGTKSKVKIPIIANIRDEERMKEVFEFFPELKEKKTQKATFLSGGQQQMLSIGRALMLEPELLLLDEPSLGLAPKTMQEIFRKIKDLNKKGTTILFVEQNAHMALEISSKAYVLEAGKIALKGKGLARKRQVKDLYLGH